MKFTPEEMPGLMIEEVMLNRAKIYLRFWFGVPSGSMKLDLSLLDEDDIYNLIRYVRTMDPSLVSIYNEDEHFGN